MKEGGLEQGDLLLCQQRPGAFRRFGTVADTPQVDATRMLQLGHQPNGIATLGQQLQVGVVAEGARKALLAVEQLRGAVERHLQVALGQGAHGRKIPRPLRRSVSQPGKILSAWWRACCCALRRSSGWCCPGAGAAYAPAASRAGRAACFRHWSGQGAAHRASARPGCAACGVRERLCRRVPPSSRLSWSPSCLKHCPLCWWSGWSWWQ